MSKTNKFGVPQSGKVGPVTFYQRNGETIVRSRTNSVSKSRKPTEDMMRTRMAMANVTRLWSLFNDELNPAFEIRKKGETAYNAFIRENYDVAKVYLTKNLVDRNAVVLPPVIISHGSLRPSIEITQEGQYYKSSIRLGSLQIDNNTTVDEFLAAVVNNNLNFNIGDYIGFFTGTQTTTIDQIPTAQVNGSRVKLEAGCHLKLYDLVDPRGFISYEGHLSYKKEDDTFCAWIHLRKTKDEEFVCTSQQMVGQNSLLASYTTEQAFETAAISYGGYENKFLTPPTNVVLTQRYTPENNGGDGGTNTGSGTGNTDPTNPSNPSNPSNPGTNPSNPSTPSLSGNIEISVAISPSADMGHVEGAGSYAEGSEVTLKAIPNSGYRFVWWQDNHDQNAQRTITVGNENQTYTAVFGEII